MKHAKHFDWCQAHNKHRANIYHHAHHLHYYSSTSPQERKWNHLDPREPWPRQGRGPAFSKEHSRLKPAGSWGQREGGQSYLVKPLYYWHGHYAPYPIIWLYKVGKLISL